ncbi:MAG: Na+/H+ antiporter NhaC [Mariniphaga sp.]
MGGIKKEATLIEAFIPILFLIALLTLNVIFFGDDTLAGSNQIALILAAGVAAVIANAHGASWKSVRTSIVKSISTSMPAMIILLLIGSLAGTWLISGVVPALIYYGLQIIHPKIFLFTAVIVSGVVSMVTGSSWSTIATIGVALLGIGKAMGINEAMVAGAIISGAYFGDKMSPLSDTTNLAPAMAGTDLFTHIRYMTITTIPAMLLTLIIFLVIGFTYDFTSVQTNIEDVFAAIEENFVIVPWLFLVPVILIAIIIAKVSPLPALLFGTLLGAIFAIIFQPHIIENIAGEGRNYAQSSYIAVMKAMYGEVTITSQNEIISRLFSTGGMAGMLNTIWLIMSAMIFGGVMEAAGLLVKISKGIISLANSTGSIIASTIGTSIFFNITASDQYIAIVVPGRMYTETFKARGLKPEVLSRTLEDGGTVTSVLVPWNTGGATQAKVLGVPTLSYLPFCFFNILSPIVSIIIAYLGYKIRYYKEGEQPHPDFTEEERMDY